MLDAAIVTYYAYAAAMIDADDDATLLPLRWLRFFITP